MTDGGNVARPSEQTKPPSERVRLRRKRERGSHDREVIDAILDEALIAHLGITDADGQPIVIPTLHARCGERRLLPRVGREPYAAGAARRRSRLPDRVAAGRARAGARGDAPLGQLPLGDDPRRRAPDRGRLREAGRAARDRRAHRARPRRTRARAERQRAEGDGRAGAGESRRPRQRSARGRRSTTRRTTRCPTGPGRCP